MSEYCLTCGCDDQAVQLRRVSCLLDLENPSCDDIEDIGVSTTLKSDLAVVFLLRKVLCLRKEFLESLLRSTREPTVGLSGLNLKLCDFCHRIFEEASFVWSRLKRLHEDFERIADVLRVKLVESRHLRPVCGGVADGQVLENREEKVVPKRRGRKPKRRPFRSAAISGVDIQSTETVGVAVDEIRKEFLHGWKDTGKAQLEHGFQAKRSKLLPMPVSVKIDPERQLSYIPDDNVTARNVSLLRARPCNSRSSNALADCEQQEDPQNTFELAVNDGDLESRTESGQNILPEESDLMDDNDGGDFDDADYSPPQSDDEGEEGELHHPELSSDESEYEPTSRKSFSSPRTARRRVHKNAKGRKRSPPVYKAVGNERGRFECPKCKEEFETSSVCDEHILHTHYGGKWPQVYTCHLCEDRHFRGENWLRYHLKMRHPGEKLPADERLDRCIDDGSVDELAYDVEPFSPSAPTTQEGHREAICDNNSQTLTIETSDAKDVTVPDEGCRMLEYENSNIKQEETSLIIPVTKKNGDVRRMVLPNEFNRLPEEILALLKEGPEELGCNLCERKFLIEIQRRAHIKDVHEGIRYCYNCPMCPKDNFERIGHMLRHIQRTHIISPFHCDRCGNIFKEAILLNAHIQRVHMGIDHPYKCLKCEQRFPRRANLNKHLKGSHKLQLKSYFPKPKGGSTKGRKRVVKVSAKKRIPKSQRKYECDICKAEGLPGVKFGRADDFDVHIKRKHMGISRPFPCPVCKKKYSRPNLMEDHLKNTHTVRSDMEIPSSASEGPAEVFVCTPCNKQFISRVTLKLHLQGVKHKNLRPFVCELCSQSFRGLLYLQNHQTQKHHKELNIVPFKCSYCDKILNSARTLDSHVRIVHTKNSRFPCPHCNNQYQHETALKTHINVAHIKTKLYLCPHCPKSFPHPQYLSNHLRLHTGEKPYECKFCQKKFADRSTYNRHVEAHSDVIHDCPVCKKTGFKTRHALGVHLKTHSGTARKKKNTTFEEFVLPSSSSSGDLTQSDWNFHLSRVPTDSTTATSSVRPSESVTVFKTADGLANLEQEGDIMPILKPYNEVFMHS